ncbi:hypothetical protein [Pseudoalteromonas phenolica]|uniref:hypothetical protein n=1 Tax=Pseudoalteromonas phenolica TaxID=161398 RepID=UPI00110BC5D3|nr:hypothetical protein [Pseudoalteromonas phenolica]TMO58315.1 hypothetical protein CWC21_01145 [Pseudoalteromonas phenolica]
MSKDEILEIIKASRAKGTSSPFVGALDREAEIDKTLVQLESCLVQPFTVEVVAAYHPQEGCEFINKPNVVVIAEANKEYLLYSISTKLFAKAWRTGENQFTLLGFSTDDVIAEWRG